MRQTRVICKTASGRCQLRLFGSCLAALILCLGLRVQGQGIELSFGNLTGATINFSGGAFSFTDGVGTSNQFSINNVANGTGSAVGLDGNLLPGGPFTIGAITSMNEPIVGMVDTAAVTGNATLYITDAASQNLTAALQWNTITVYETTGVLNLTGVVNLTGISYSGANSDLATLAAAGSASDVLSFQFNPAETLYQLAGADSPGLSTSYSGSITAVPEPAVFSLLGAGLGLLALARRRS